MKHLFLIIGLVFTTQSFAQTDGQIRSKIDSIFSHFENQPGCAVAVVKDGKAVFKKGYGLANLSYDIPISSSTMFDFSTNAQQFTAACIYLLEQEGKLSLNDPIQKYLPEMPTYSSVPITVSNLLYHTSGLRSFYATLHAKNVFFGDSHDNDDVIEILSKHKQLNFPTGTKHYFSNTNYILLANIIEKVTGKTLGTYANEKLFEPLGMTQTFFKEEREVIIKNRAISYELDENTVREDNNYNSTVVGQGGLYTSLDDLIIWSDNISKGKIGGASVKARMTTSHKLANGAETECSGGLFATDYDGIEGLPVVMHNGGFNSFYYQFLNQDVTFIVLSNNSNTYSWGLLDQLVPLFLSEEVEAARQKMSIAQNDNGSFKRRKLSKNDKKKFCGKYYGTLNGYLREIKLEDDKLMYIRPGAAPTPMIALSSNQLAYEALPFIKFTFDEQDDYRSMVVTVNDANPLNYEKYDTHSYSPSALKQFENVYYNEDIDEEYQLVALEDELQILVGGNEIVRMNPIEKDLFTSDHSGYLKFNRNEKGEVTGFVQYDDHLYNLAFNVKSTKTSTYKEISNVLMDYIEGTANGLPDRVRSAFHEDLNLYSIKNDSLSTWYGKDYINGIKQGKKNKRQGKIISIDYENNAASAKVEILIPGWRVFTDYFLLLKIQGKWKVVHKSYTWRGVNEVNG